MKINSKTNIQKTQILLKNPRTKKIIYIFDSIIEASKYLNISYKTFQRHLKKNPIQMYGAPDFIKKIYNLDQVIWENSDKLVLIPLEIRDLKIKLVKLSKFCNSNDSLISDKSVLLKNKQLVKESEEWRPFKKEFNSVLEYVDLKNKDVAEKIKKDTEGKVGVYLIKNLVNNFKFVGVVKSVGKDRLGFYRAFRKIIFNNSERYLFLKNDIKIHGIECFKFVILEFTNEQEVVTKKNLYITKFKPEYNKKQLSRTVNKEVPKSIKICAFSNPNTKSYHRIGPHLEKIISIIFGTLLGDSFAERRKYKTQKGVVKGGTRICFQQEDSNMEYLMSFWKEIAEMGYCRLEKPKLLKRIGKHGKIRRYYKFNTWTFLSFNWIHDLWYDVSGIKRVPLNIEKYLTPRALAHWIMDDGSKSNYGVKLSTNSFTYSELKLLCSVLKKKFDLNCSIQSAGVKNQWILDIKADSMNQLNKIVLPYFVESMKKKLHL